MGGVRVDETLRACILGLYTRGETMGAANGAKRFSSKAITRSLCVRHPRWPQRRAACVERAALAAAGR
jgi:aspartate oxidase